MTCCIVGLLIMAAFGRVRRLFGRAEAPMLFAPTAQRPAPGQTITTVEPVAESPRDSPVLRYCAFGVLLCLIAGPLAVVFGAAQNTAAMWVWLLRGACYLAVAVTAIRLSRSAVIWRAPAGAGTLMVVVGAVIFELGVFDMHVFRLYSVGTPLGYFAFHNVGPAVAMAGGLALAYGSLGRSRTSWRSPRSTVSSAQPSSPAVTLSSTPPLTT